MQRQVIKGFKSGGKLKGTHASEVGHRFRVWRKQRLHGLANSLHFCRSEKFPDQYKPLLAPGLHLGQGESIPGTCGFRSDQVVGFVAHEG